MAIPLCKLEGTWQEISAHVPNFDSPKLQVLVYAVEETQQTAPADRRATILNTIAENTTQMNLAPDSRDYLREGRAGGMFPDDSAK